VATRSSRLFNSFQLSIVGAQKASCQRAKLTGSGGLVVCRLEMISVHGGSAATDH